MAKVIFMSNKTAKKADEAPDRREFFRLNFKSPLNFRSYSLKAALKPVPAPKKEKGVSQNISASGVLFQIQNNPPRVSSVLWMNLDIRTLKICQEIEKRALIFNNGILGRVVRVEEDPAKINAYNVGVCFITQEQKRAKEIERILSQISQSK